MAEQERQGQDAQNINVTVNMTAPQYVLREKRIDKNIFVWVCAALLGGFGIDRFMRGQIFMGILKFISAGGCCIWWVVDFFIAMSKAYSDNAFGAEKEIVFIGGKYAR